MTSKSISRMTNGLVIELVNTLRESPMTFVPKFLTVSKALTRATKKEAGKELEDISKEIGIINNLKKLEMSDGLTIVADELVRKFINIGDENIKLEKKDIEELCSQFLNSYENLYYILDYGDIDNLVTRVLITENDPKRANKAAIFSTEYNYIGAASRLFVEEDLSLIIFASKVEEKKSNEDYAELRAMFEAFDEKDTGYIDPLEIYVKLLENEYEQKNPTLLELFKRLKDNKIKSRSGTKGIDYETFKNGVIGFHVKKPIETREDWKKVFNLFVDDPQANTISLQNIKRIIKFLEEDCSIKDLRKFMKWASANGSELTFDEFYDIVSVQLPKQELDEKEIDLENA